MYKIEKMAKNTKIGLTFKPFDEKCSDFARDALPTPGYPGSKEFAWESRNPIFGFWSFFYYRSIGTE